MKWFFFLMGIAIGIVVATMCILVVWFYDKRYDEQKSIEAQEESYNKGFKKGTIWKYRQIVAAERALFAVECKVDELIELEKARLNK